MITPVKNVMIVSPFGMRTLRYIHGGAPHMHNGVDIRAPFGTVILAPEKLKILRAGVGDWQEGFIVAQGLDSGFVLKFIHVSALHTAGIIAEGDGLTASDGSGTTDGNGGHAPHLHFEVWTGGAGRPPKGAPIDPVENYFERYGLTYA